jgi:uncharacterized protein YdeI (YjbR/CyaY-like superfamily)
MKPRYFRTTAELRRWFEANHATASALMVGFHKKGAGPRTITYVEALEEALCFGWIDGVRRTVDDRRYAQRFSPRRPGSNWSEPNIARVRRLIEQGRMHAAGLAAFERRDEGRGAGSGVGRETAAFDRAAERTFRANRPAWRFWQAQPPGYRRTATWWVVSAKREETRARRLATVIEHSARGERVPQVTGVTQRCPPERTG